MTEAVIDDLEIVDIDQQQSEGFARCRMLSEGRVEGAAVAEPRQLVAIGEELVAGVDLGVFIGKRTQMHRAAHQFALDLGRAALRPEIEGEGGDHASVAGLDRAGPAGFQPQWLGQPQIGLPLRIGVDIRCLYRHTEIGGGPAGADFGTDGRPVQRFGIALWQAWRGDRPDEPVGVDPCDRAYRPVREPLGFTAQEIGHRVEILVRRNGFQNKPLKGGKLELSL